MYVSSVGTKSAESFPANPIVVHMKGEGPTNCQFLWPPPFSAEFLNEATIDSVLLAAIEQFEDQATNRLLIAALKEYMKT